MKNYFTSVYWFFVICFSYISKVVLEYFYIWFYLSPLLKKKCNTVNYQLSKEERKKALKYYPLLTLCANADNYVLLKNRSLNHRERKKLTLMSAMATLYDDLLDEEGWSTEKVMESLSENIDIASVSKKAQLIYYLNCEFKKLNISTNYWQQLRLSFFSQIDSLKQTQGNLSKEETLQISRNKNGQTSLLVSTLIDGDFNENEREVIYQSGVMGQLMNDIFDTHKDYQAGIFTLMSKISSVKEIDEIFRNELKKLYLALEKTSLSKAKQQYLKRRLSPIHAFGLVAIHHLYLLEKKYGEVSAFKNLPRQEILFDMARWKNRFLYLQKMEEVVRV